MTSRPKPKFIHATQGPGGMLHCLHCGSRMHTGVEFVTIGPCTGQGATQVSTVICPACVMIIHETVVAGMQKDADAYKDTNVDYWKHH